MLFPIKYSSFTLVLLSIKSAFTTVVTTAGVFTKTSLISTGVPSSMGKWGVASIASYIVIADADEDLV